MPIIYTKSCSLEYKIERQFNFILFFLFFIAELCTSDMLNAQSSVAPNSKRMAAITASVPPIIGTGYCGVLGIGSNFQNTTRLNNTKWGPDFSALVALGLGNPEKSVGADLRFNIYGLSDKIGQPSNLGETTIDCHFSRKINTNIWIGIGGYDLGGWQRSEPNKLKSFYGAVSYILPLKNDSLSFLSKVYITAGLGNGKFRADDSYTLKHSNPIGVFGSVAVQIVPEGNFIAEWSGYGLYSGFSLYPFKRIPFQITLGYDDMLHAQRRFVIAASLGFYLKKDKGNKLYLPPPPPPQTSRV
jgi:hypothetical protein